MRLHELEVAAFGPFTDAVTVDFDDLSAQGLFLLSGPTGAGKTSVLDAVCFALYGEVPGERAGAKRLRSDQAPPQAEPRVRLLATLAGRRLEITRSPAWQRPKLRGEGTTAQQATVRVREDVGGDWTTLTTRHDEAGLLVGGLLGMNQAQFTQVAMLPQGRFQAFLRAGADERQKLLQQLFGTARFERVEGWLKQRRTDVRREVEAAHRSLADAVSRTSEAAGAALPGWDCDDLAEPALSGQVGAWAAGLAEQVGAAHRELVSRSEAVQRAETLTGAVAREARARRERHERRQAALGALAELEARAAEHTVDLADLAAAQRARGVAPLHALSLAAHQAHQDALVARTAALDVAAGAFEADEADETAWSARARSETRAADAAEHLVPLARRLVLVGRDLAEHRGALPELRQRRVALRDALEAAPAQLSVLRAALDESRGAAAALVGLHAAVQVLDQRRDARARAVRLEEDLDGARVAHRLAREHTLGCRETVLDLREARLAGMAGEIAHALAAGESCPVCGSAEHPAKAEPSTAGPDQSAESAAQRLADDASATELVLDQEVRALESRLAAVRAGSGEEDAATLEAGLVEAEAALAVATDLAAQVPTHASELAEAERAQRELGERCSGAETDLARSETTIDSLEREAADLGVRLLAHLDGREAEDLPAHLETVHRHHAARAQAAAAAASAVETCRRAGEEHDRVARRLGEALAASGFDDVEQASRAELAEDAIAALAVRVRDHDRRLAAVRALLADLAVDPDDPAARTGDDAADLPDVDALDTTHRDARAALVEHRTLVEDLARRARRLDDLATQVDAALARWAPRHDELAQVLALSSFVEGKGADNRWQMRLSAYVLAFRLGQVVAAANVRLGRMSDQRYSLEHTAERGRDRRGGLGLQVRDDWSGEARSPATLSGGETFVVSLALALGLSDVVTAEAGGADLDTLFVDEGFGSLDPDTLDDVMDTLDALRDGGRVVGVVSHVAEMRERIPTRLVVSKARTGSTLSVRVGSRP